MRNFIFINKRVKIHLRLSFSFFLILAIALSTCAAVRVGKRTAKDRLIGQQENGTILLEREKPIEREIKGGESHTYQLDLIAGQYLYAMIELKGIDVGVEIYQ